MGVRDDCRLMQSYGSREGGFGSARDVFAYWGGAACSGQEGRGDTGGGKAAGSARLRSGYNGDVGVDAYSEQEVQREGK
jgi:hypothetical protein